MGVTSSAPEGEPSLQKASAALSLESAVIGQDFVLQIKTKESGQPRAILETHPTIPGQRALMATLVPKFALPPSKPEIVFIVDRSGSMGGKMQTVISALKVFLKSLPVGVKFNICSFGSRHSFLWSRSKSYGESTLKEAEKHVSGFSSNYGGTDMLKPVTAVLDHRYGDMSLEVILLTDGEIWDQQSLFDLLNERVIESKAPIRIFSLGIGNDFSHSLIEGIARAGNGFSQAVREGENLNTKVVRMLKAALTPHITDYTLECKYENEAAVDDDFEIIEKVADSLKVNLNLNDSEPQQKAPAQKKPISLFDPSADVDMKDAQPEHADHDGQQKYAHLPVINAPKYLQAPYQIPTPFLFHSDDRLSARITGCRSKTTEVRPSQGHISTRSARA